MRPPPLSTSDVQTLRDEVSGLDAQAKRMGGELKEIFTGLGYRWGDGSDAQTVFEAAPCDLNGLRGRRHGTPA